MSDASANRARRSSRALALVAKTAALPLPSWMEPLRMIRSKVRDVAEAPLKKMGQVRVFTERGADQEATLIERIGEGGMAYVYLAHDLKHDRKVAIKVLRPELVHALGPERFLRDTPIGLPDGWPVLVDPAAGMDAKAAKSAYDRLASNKFQEHDCAAHGQPGRAQPGVRWCRRQRKSACHRQRWPGR